MSGGSRVRAGSTRRHTPVRVVTADGQPLFRDPLGRALDRDPGLELVGEAADAASLVDLVRRQRPDVVLVDSDLVDGGVMEVAGETRILVLAARLDPTEAYNALEAGVVGYRSKDSDAVTICRSVAAVARGETVLDPTVHSGIAREIRLRVRDERPLLSGREREILALIAEGRSAPEIGRHLHVSTATVKTHLLHLYSKLGVTERAAAVAGAMRQGLLE
jgi:two-component system, NarL family, nitrate/nitrite response regulator NarL